MSMYFNPESCEDPNDPDHPPYDQEQAAEAFFAAARKELAPKVKSSAVGMSILNGDVDPKIAIEIGYILLMGKPLILVVVPGVKVPDGLARAASAILEMHEDTAVMAQRLGEALEEVIG